MNEIDKLNFFGFFHFMLLNTIYISLTLYERTVVLVSCLY